MPDWVVQCLLFGLAALGGGGMTAGAFVLSVKVALALYDQRIKSLEDKAKSHDTSIEQVKRGHQALDIKLVTEMGDIKSTLARIEAKLEGKGR